MYSPSPLALATGRYGRHRRRRRGVLLLIVLCVLFMFMLLALTYVVVASKERTVTRNFARLERSGDPPNVVLDAIAMMIFRDTNDPHSPFRGLSLEEGIWGNVSFRGTLGGNPTPQAGGQFLQFTPTTASFNSTPNYYKGCVLTMLTGQCAGLSTRIVASASGSITVMRFQADAGMYDPAGPQASNNNQGDTFLINGRAYCGMGRGYNTSPTGATDPANNALDPNGWPYALLPNPFGFQPNGSYTDPSGPGGANIDYTAADYNNPFLALMLNNTTISQSGILPSFYRPALYNYWAAQVPNLASNSLLLRKVTFRPNLVDSKYFCQNTNPNFQPGNPASQFDVDNLGDGIPDSIWIDPGLPVMTARDGRTYKVLVAPCILDLDGRINVNAHGSVLNTDTTVSPTGQNGATATSNGTAVLAGVNNGTTILPVGQGYGPADINLNGIFSAAEVKALIEGISGSWPGRYGGSPGNNFSGSSNLNRPLELVKMFEYPIIAAQTDNPLSVLTSFGTPPDLRGRRMVGVDPRGNPIFITPSINPQSPTYWNNEVQSRTGGESPYAFNLSRSVPRVGRIPPQAPSGVDNPFTVGELEAILREYDFDRASLPQRLYAILPSVQQNANQRNKITTESFSLPVPNLQPPRGLRPGLAANGYRAYGITDLLNAKFAEQCPGMVGNNAEIAKLLPPELIAGLRMDLNRPFGNGRADTPGAVPDTPGGISSNNPSAPDANPETQFVSAGSYPEPLPSGISANSGYTTQVPFNLVNGSSTTKIGADPVLASRLPPGVQARELMARHLYALMMLFADQQFFGWTVEPGLTAQQQQQLTARRIAQWAINAVSFRDSTSIMTPFVYQWDIYQSSYQGWVVDGDPGNTAQASPNYGVVWGCKPPDAVITEAIAFHDKRIADTNWDSGNNHYTTDMPPDQGGGNPTPAGKQPPAGNFDQVQIPQGSLFVELNCTRNPNTPFAPTDLYTKNASGQYCLDLSRMTPDGSSPIWRIAISKSRIANPNCDVLTQVQNHPDTTTFEPTTDPTAPTGTPLAQSCQQMNLFNPGANVPIERIVWLGLTPPPAATRATLSPGWTAAAGAQIYYNRTGASTLVPPGSYAVIGPRATTYVGAAGNYISASQWGIPSKQKIQITPSVAVTDVNGTSTMPTSTFLKSGTYAAVGMVVAADPPPAAVWSNSTAYTAQSAAGIGLNVSEPLPLAGTTPGNGYYPQPTVPHTSSAANLLLAGVYDAYDDLTQTTQSAGRYLDQPLEEVSSNVTYPNLVSPLMADSIYKTGTTQNYRTVFLQRLADPTSGYDALRNPYITVDWMPVDLTVFNGEDTVTNPNDPNGTNQLASVLFASRQRGGSSFANAPPPAISYNLWAPVQAGDTLVNKTQPTSSQKANFTVTLNHTLGYLNQGYGTGLASNTPPGSIALQYVGDPAYPFPWIDWNARPYASPMELMNVPASSPDRLLFEFNSPGSSTPTTPNPFQGAANVYSSGVANVRAPFGHLLNFFNSSTASYAAGSAWNLYRLFDYVQVRSPFVGCETYLNPKYFAAGSSDPNTQYFQPPFNWVSNYRDPGKMNLNTITDANVWNCLLNGLTGPTFAQLCDSRRCDGGSSGVVINPGTQFPTYFSNAFRSAAGADLVPLSTMLHDNVNATLLRAGGPTPDTATVPLFAGGLQPSPVTVPTNPSACTNSTRDSYFAYQGLERVANNVTTRSNVFAVWLTIGYFEAVPWSPIDVGHPDGYQLGEEIGSDTGEVERHRAFYIFDRSIPVGYERGQNHNVNRAILLKRFIE